MNCYSRMCVLKKKKKKKKKLAGKEERKGKRKKCLKRPDGGHHLGPLGSFGLCDLLWGELNIKAVDVGRLSLGKRNRRLRGRIRWGVGGILLTHE